MNKIKRNFKVYSILIVIAVIASVTCFNVVKAQSPSDEYNILDKVIEILRLTNKEVEPQLGLSAQVDGYVVTKKIDYDDITTTGVAASNQVTGAFYVENVIIEMGALTIASGTQIQILTSGDDFGSSTLLFATDVAAFTKATTMDLNTAISSGSNYLLHASSTQRVVLEDGSNLIIKCTGADCKRTTDGTQTGTGFLRVTVILEKADRYSSTFE